MRDEQKTKEELLKELKALRRDLEQAEQRKSNLGTKEYERIFRTIFENAADGILLADVENKKFYMGNNIICQMLGIDKKDVKDLGVMDIHPEQDLPYVMEQFEKQARGEITLAKDIPVKRKNGSVLFVEINSFPIKLDGKTYLLGIFRDVSERKQAEEKWRSLVETAPSFIMTVNEDGTIQFLNRPTGGMTVEQAIGTTVYEYVEPGHCDIMRRSIEKVFKTGESVSYEILGLGPDGPNSAWYETHLGPVIRDGRVAAVTMISTDITERKKAENALVQSEEKFRLAMEATNDALWDWDIVTHEVYRNPRHATMLGYESNELTASQDEWENRIHPDDKKAVFQILDEHLAGKRDSFEIEYRLRTKSGDYVWVLGRGKIVTYNDNGLPTRMIGTNIDITERKRAEKAKTEYQTLIRGIMDNAGSIVLVRDLQGHYLMVNREVEKVLGMESERIIGKTPYDIHSNDKANKILADDKRVIESRNLLEIEDLLDVKGETRTYLGTKFPLLNANGEVYAVCTISTDITEHKQAEEEIRKFKTIADKAGHGVAIADLQGNLVYVNDSFAQMHQYDRDELIGKNLSIFHNETQMERVNQLNDQIKHKGGYVAEEVWHNKRDNTVFPTLMSATLVREESGEPLFMAATAIDITRHKKAEESLKESELRYRTLFGFLPVGVGLSTLEGRIIDANSTFQQMIGYSMEEMRRINVLDTYYNPAERPPFLKQLQQDGIVRGFEVQLKRKDGTTFLASLNVTAMKIRNETVFVTVAKDITEQRNMEKALTESEEKYRTLVECAGDPISTIDKKGVLLFANKVAAENMGCQPEDLVGKTLWDLFPKDMPDRLAADVRKVIETGQGINTVSLIEIQGQPHWYNNTIEPLKDDRGNVTAAMVIARDVDDIKRAEEQIQKLSSAVESSINGIAIGDGEGNLTYINHAFLEMWGYDNENKVLGRNAVEFWQTRDEGIKILETVINKGSWIGEMTALKKDGSTFDVQVCATLVTDENGKPISMMGSFIDISEMKRKEEELSRYRGQMAHAEQLASLGTLSATIAHQLTQPLTVIRLSMDNALDELQASSSSQTVIRRLKESVTQVSNITSIIERFRNFARKSSGRTVAEVNLKAVAVRIARLLSESARSANIILRIRNMDDLPCPFMNENDLEQLFFALIENAIQAADGKKTRQLVISGAVKDEHIELHISDNCGGIKPENLDKIFEPFFTTKPRGQGTGLGLCIVKDVVSRNGGRVQVESEFGKGTTFTISLHVDQGKIS